METALLIDFGSTFTKLTAVDMGRGLLLGQAQAPTTAHDSLLRGFEQAMDELNSLCRQPWAHGVTLASSSAAGGLRIVAIGLVPELTLYASQVSALGAGANIVASFSYEITKEELASIRRLRPEIIVLCGGSDGGNQKVVLHNARMLATISERQCIVYAGNKCAADACAAALHVGGHQVLVTENVMPRLGELNAAPLRGAIRTLFSSHIIRAKGLEAVAARVSGPIIPTPDAVLRAAELLALGCPGNARENAVLVADVGGATTDIHSVCRNSVLEGALRKGTEEPAAKRTVEGDLGVRHNAPSLVAAASDGLLEQFSGLLDWDWPGFAAALAASPAGLPCTEAEQAADAALAAVAVDLAVSRHVGRLEFVQTPFQQITLQAGKNLCSVGMVVGTGGALIHSITPEKILNVVPFSASRPLELRPRHPRLYLDESYLLYAIGLLAQRYPRQALLLAEKYLKELA